MSGTSELRAILTADIRGFSQQMAVNEEAGLALMAELYTLSTRHAKANGGDLFRKEGDAVWLSFKSALSALKAAIGLQADIAKKNEGRAEPQRIALRIGVHLGEVTISEDGELLG